MTTVANAEVLTTSSTPPARPGSSRILEWIEKYTLVLLLGATIAFFALLPETGDVYFSADNLRILLAGQSILLVASLATLMPLLTTQYDLSIGNTITLTSIVMASLMAKQQLDLSIAVLVGILVGGCVGAFNGWLSAYVGVNSLIATLGVGTVITGLVQGYTGGVAVVSGLPPAVAEFGTGSIGPIPYIFITAAAVALVLGYLVRFLPVGRRMLAVGSNPNAARLVGISVQRLILTSFVVGGVVAAIGGFLQLASSGAANPTLGGTLSLPALAAVCLGATAIKPGSYNIAGTVVAVMFLGALTSGLTLSGLDDWVNVVVNGGALVGGVGISAVLAKRRVAH